MSFNQIMPALGILVAIISAFVPLEWWPLILLLVGLVHGFGGQEKDPVIIVSVVLAAIAFPTIADSLNAIPMIGAHLDTIIDNFAIAIGGYAIALLVLDLKDRIMPAEA
ncbi:MAG TPA: hypothetical protein EYG52_18430 [Pseudomonadales bacterium]|jgi:hypothetical protein|nr:hypothetical protein [Pseudomonadales bacterium]